MSAIVRQAGAPPAQRWATALRGGTMVHQRPAPRLPPPPLDMGPSSHRRRLREQQRQHQHQQRRRLREQQGQQKTIDMRDLASKARTWRRGDARASVNAAREAFHLWRQLRVDDRLRPRRAPTFLPAVVAAATALARRASTLCVWELFIHWAVCAQRRQLVALLWPHVARKRCMLAFEAVRTAAVQRRRCIVVWRRCALGHSLGRWRARHRAVIATHALMHFGARAWRHMPRRLWAWLDRWGRHVALRAIATSTAELGALAACSTRLRRALAAWRVACDADDGARALALLAARVWSVGRMRHALWRMRRHHAPPCTMQLTPHLDALASRRRAATLRGVLDRLRAGLQAAPLRAAPLRTVRVEEPRVGVRSCAAGDAIMFMTMADVLRACSL